MLIYENLVDHFSYSFVLLTVITIEETIVFNVDKVTNFYCEFFRQQSSISSN
jgi:hypothetical protein